MMYKLNIDALHTCDVVSRRIIVVVVVVVAGCSSEGDVLAVDAVWWTESKALEWAAGAADDTLQLLINGQVVVDAAQQSVVTEGKLITRHQPTTARHAAEALDVVDVTARPHHQIRHAEPELTAGTLGTE